MAKNPSLHKRSKRPQAKDSIKKKKTSGSLEDHGFARQTVREEVKYVCPRCQCHFSRRRAFDHVHKYKNKKCQFVAVPDSGFRLVDTGAATEDRALSHDERPSYDLPSSCCHDGNHHATV